MQHIPLTDSMMRVSHRMIEESLYAAGYIYNTDFAEFALAAAQYEDLIRRYPQGDYLIPSYYYLYVLYNKLGKSIEAEKYKNLLLTQSPESVFAKIVLDPSYLEKLAQEKGETEKLYEQTYDHYNKSEYQMVINLATDALERFPKDVLAPKFAYLSAISAGKIAGTEEAMRNEMRKITSTYPSTDVAKEAQNLIDFIDSYTPEMRQAEQVERAKALYTYDEIVAHYFAWAIDVKENINQLSFDIQKYNIEHYTNDQLGFERVNIGARYVLLMVKGLPNFASAQNYYRYFVMDSEVMKNVMYQNDTFLITESNLAILEEDKKVEDYIEFFKKEYLKQ